VINGAAHEAIYKAVIIKIVPPITVLSISPLNTAAIKATIKGIVAKSPKGKVILPGNITARNNVMGINIKEGANAEGWPIAKALSIPINKSLLGNLLFTHSVADSEIGVSPSINKETILGKSNIIPAVTTPKFKVSLTLY